LWNVSLDEPQSTIINDTRNDPRWTDVPQARWIHAHLNVPISLEGETIGFINCDSSQFNAFTTADAENLTLFAHQAATALKNARLFTAEHEQLLLAEALIDVNTALNSTLELDEVLNRILDNVNKVMTFDTADIVILEKDVFRVVGSRGYEKYGIKEWFHTRPIPPRAFGLWGSSLKTGVPEVFPDMTTFDFWKPPPELAWVRSHLHLPIDVDREIIGFINLNSETSDFFNEQHIESLLPFGQQAAIAIKNARLFAAEHEQRVFAEALVDIIATINSTLELDEVMTRILDNLGKMVACDTSTIMLIEDQQLRVVASRGYEKFGLREWIDHLSFDLSQPSRWTEKIQSKQVRVYTDTRQESEWFYIPETDWVRSHLSLPILLNDELLGFIDLDSLEPNTFTIELAHRLQSLSQQVSIAIRNARLFAAEREQRRFAETHADMVAALSSTLDYREILSRILENIAIIFGHDSATIMMIEQDQAKIVSSMGYERRGLRQWAESQEFPFDRFPDIKQVVETGEPYLTND
ncbi:MAG TPA: GAF domain-containing protein, partial [Aggregatilineales bacterium]|nr:GAF domain-containing protein [Aggregatilineales bacterium]